MPFGINLGGSGGNLSDILGKPNAGPSSFNQSLKTGHFDSFGGTMQANQWNRLAEFTVPAQERYRWGYGRAINPENQGHMYVYLQDGSSNEVIGSLRIGQTNAQETTKLVVYENESDTMHGSKSDRTQQQPLPEQVDKPKVGRDSKLILEFNPDADTPVTIDEAQTDVILPVTTYEL